MDPVIESVIQTKSVLQSNTWIMTDYTIKVKNPDIPPPMLINVSDSSIEAGNYHLPNSLPAGSEFPQFIMQFSTDNKILTDSAYTDNFIGMGGKYFVFNETQIRLKPSRIEKLTYRYHYSPDNKTMTFTLTAEDATKAIEKATQKLIDDAVNERPDKIGSAISDKLHNSPKIKAAIEKWLKHALAGKLPGIFDHNIEHNTQQMSEKLRAHLLDSINWKGILGDAIHHELEKISNMDADSLTPLATADVVEQIGLELTTQDLYDIILPYTASLERQDNDSKAEKIATLIVRLLGDIFSEENLEKIIEPIWEKFTKLSDAQVDTIAVQLTTIVEDEWLNVDTLSQVFLPITQKIDATPIPQLNALAQEATDSLEVFVDKLNNRFPGLGLDPDYDNIESVIHSILVAAKPVIGIQGPQKVAEEIAEAILGTVLSTQKIESAFIAAIDFLQTIDPQTAAQTIATWLVALEQRIAPELIAWLTEKLGPILDNQNPKLTAKTIGNKVRDFSLTNMGFGTIKDLVLPELDKTLAVSGREVAHHIAQAIIDHKMAKEGVSVEQLGDVIFANLHDDGSGNGIGARIKQAMADHDMIRAGKSPDFLGKIISFILYAEASNGFKIANNFEEAQIIIRHK